MLNTYLRDEDTKSILIWLQSANTEKQLYALKGLKVLAKNGYTPTSEENKLIALIRQKEGTVNTCSGCTFSSDTIANIIAEIDAWDGNVYIGKKGLGTNVIYFGLTGIVFIFLIFFFNWKRRKTKAGIQ